jgi:curved DNA-binding protein CbpA
MASSGTWAVIDPYTVLGVARSATREEIRSAYRALVERYHPDRHHGNPLENLANERMVTINRAYDVLSDPSRRAAFDQRGSRSPARPAPAAAPRMSSLATWGLALLFLPLLLRSGTGILRALAGLLRALFGELGSFRGSPVVLVLALVAAFFLGRALWQRSRRRPR